MRISKSGLALVKEGEGFCPFVYDDMRPVRGTKYGYLPWDGGPVRGTLTIGYGHTDDAKHPLKCRLGVTVTEAEAAQILDVDLDECEADVSRLVKVRLTQGQFDALVSFQFNTGALAKSTLLRLLNRGDVEAVPAEFEKYVYVTVGGQKRRVQGLVNRRDAELRQWEADVPLADAASLPPDVPAPEPEAELGATVVPDRPPGTEPKPLARSKTLWGAIVAGVSALGGEAADLAREVEGLLPMAPQLKTAFVVLTLVGLAWAVYGRLKVREDHGV